MRYRRLGGRGFYSRTEKTRSQKNACKSRRIPHVGCTLCWHAFWVQEIHNQRRVVNFKKVGINLMYDLATASTNSLGDEIF